MATQFCHRMQGFAIFFIFSARLISSTSNCSGAYYVIPDYLRCTHINVASAVSGGTCAGAYENQNMCDYVIDGIAAAGSNDWYANAGPGIWIKIHFFREYLINTIRVMQKAGATQQNKGLRLEFSDGSEAFVELSSNTGSADDEAVWDVRSFADVNTTFVKIVVETVYSSDHNGFKEIEFYYDYCNRDKLCDSVTLPAEGRTELRPLFGNTIAFVVKAAKDVSVTLYEKPQSASARYRFAIGSGDGTWSIHRADEGGSETMKKSENIPNPLVAGQWRTFWVDFRSSHLVLGSGGEVLMQWDDEAPVTVSYVSFTGSPDGTTEIILCNRLNKCYKDADHYWPLDKVIAGKVVDLVGHKHGAVSNWELGLGPAVGSMRSSGIIIKSAESKTIDFGEFSESCISDSTVCDKGITVSFWVKVNSGSDSVILASAEDSNERGLLIVYHHSSSELTVTMSPQSCIGHGKVKITAAKWYHVMSVWEKTKYVLLFVNGVERFAGWTSYVYSLDNKQNRLLAGKSSQDSESDAILADLVIWLKALDWKTLLNAFYCAGIQPELPACSSIDVSDRVPCGWVGIGTSDCEHIGCCFQDGVCFQRDGHSGFSKLGSGSSSPAILSASTFKDLNYTASQARLTWRLSTDNSWPDHAWLPRTTAGEQWLQLDLNQVKAIKAIATQGYQYGGESLFVTSYTLAHSLSGTIWQPYKENDTIKVFSGSTDGTGVVKNNVSSPFNARFIRFYVKSWSGEPALKVEAFGSPTAVNYKGCYSEGLFTASGDYALGSLTPEVCTTRCGLVEATYAALRNGDQCLCSNSLEEDRKVGDAQCNEPCNGNLALTCGGFYSLSVYQALGNYAFSLTMEIPNNVSLFETINASFTSQEGAIHTVNFGENIVVVTESLSPYTYHTLGTHTVHGMTSLGEYGEPQMLSSFTQVNVHSIVEQLEYGCPSVVEANQVFECKVKAYSGHDMLIEGHFDGGDAVSANMDDVRSLAVGEVFGTPDGGSLMKGGGRTVLIPSYIIEEEGKLFGWRICTETSGSVSLQIFRPICAKEDTRSYCFINGECRDDLELCSKRNVFLCSSAEVFFTATGVCTTSNISPNTISSVVLSGDYELVSERNVSLHKPGCHFLKSSDSVNEIFVAEGDILGFSLPRNGFAEITSRKSAESMQYNASEFSYSDLDVSVGSILSPAGNSSPPETTQTQYSLAAIQLVPSIFLFPHNYSIGHYDEEVTVKGPWNQLTRKAHLTATESISNLTWTVPTAVATNVPYNVVIHPHKGYNVTHLISFGDTSNQTSFKTRLESDLLFSAVSTEIGVVEVSLVVSNIVSIAGGVCEVLVQDSIEGLAFYLPIAPVTLHNVTEAKWFMTQGNGVNVTVDFGDGETIHNGSFDVHNLFAGVLYHQYQETGAYLVTINCSNFVSNATSQGLAIVEIPLAGFDFQVVKSNRDIEVNETIALSLTLTEGTNPKFDIDFGDGSLTSTWNHNVSHSYQQYAFYNVSVSAFNNVSRLNISKQIQVQKPVYPLIGFNVSCDHANLTRPSPCMLNISVETDFRCSWDWGDGSVSVTVFGELGNVTYHNYSDVGHYDVSLNCSNRLYNTSTLTVAIVEEPIEGFNLSAPVAQPFKSDFTVVWEITKGTDPIFNVTFTHEQSGLSTKVPASNPRSTVITEDMMPTIGEYSLKVTAVNFVTLPQTINVLVVIDVPITRPSLNRSSRFVEVKKTANFSCQVETGTNVSLFWDYQDGSTPIQFFMGEFPAEGVTVGHEFLNPGTYIVSVTGNNSLSTFTSSIPVYIQNPVKLKLQSNSPQNIPPGTIKFNVTVLPGEEAPTNSTYEVYFGDGESTPKLPFLPPLFLHHNYSENGSYQVNVTVKNDVSFVVLVAVVEVQTPIVALELFALLSAPDEDRGKPGLGPNNMYFPCDDPVLFNTSIESGTNVSYTWDLGDGYSTVTLDKSISYKFADDRRYFVTVVAENAVSKKEKVVRVDMQWTVKIDDFKTKGPAVRGESVVFEIGILKVGNNSCYLLNMNDNTTYYYQTNNDPSFLCPEACRAGREATPLSNPSKFTHAYSTLDKFNVSAVVCNMVSVVRHEVVASCVPKPCSNPNITFDETTVGNSTTHAKVYYKSKQFTVKSEVETRCQATNKTKFLWKVRRFENESGIRQDFPLPEIIKSKLTSLTVAPRLFDYGFYELKFTASMDGGGVKGVSAFKVGYIKIISSPMEASIARGTGWGVGYGKETTLNASQSKDPDVKLNSPEDFEYCWICVKKGSAYDRDLINNCTSLPAYPLVRNPALFNSTNNDSQSSQADSHGGCFGYPPGRLNASTPAITINTMGMDIDGEYEFHVRVVKGDRASATKATITVKAGDPPPVEINCIINCRSKLDPSNKLSLTGRSCKLCRSVEPKYRWSVSQEDSPDVWVETESVESRLSTSLNEDVLVVKPDVLLGGVKYRFRLESWIPPDTSTGFADFVRVVNKPPESGSCDVWPESGFAFERSFKVNCSGWKDEGSSLTYLVTAKPNSQGTELTTCPTTTVTNHGDYESVASELPMGSSENGYVIKIFVSIVDEDGAVTRVNLSAEVRMQEVSKEEKDALLSNKAAEMEKLLSEGNFNGVLSSAASLTSAMQNQDDGSNPELNEQILGVLVAVEPTDPVGAIQLSGTLAAVKPESDKSKEFLAEALSNTVSLLDSEEITATQVLQLTGNLVVCVGGLFNFDDAASSESTVDPTDALVNETAQLENKKQLYENTAAIKATMMKSIGSSLLPGEEPLMLESMALSITVEKTKQPKAASCGRSSMSNLESAVDPNSTQVLQIGASCVSGNPMGHVKGEVNSGIAELTFSDENGNPITIANRTDYIDIFVGAKTNNTKLSRHLVQKHEMLLLSLEVRNNRSAIYVWAVPKENNTKTVILCKKGSAPTLQGYDFKQEVPRSSEQLGNASNGQAASSSETEYQRFQLFINNDDVNETAAGLWYCGFYYNGSLSEADKDSVPEKTNLTITIFENSCKYHDTTTDEWKYDGCKSGPLTTPTKRHCRCNHLTSFASDLFVPPNKIDWDKVSLEELLKNPLVFSVVLVIFGLYLLLVLWARRADGKDLEKVGVAPLPDNDPRDTYLYEVIVYTGFTSQAGTSSEVRMVLSGGLDETSPRRLKDTVPRRRKFCRGNVDYFLLSVPRSLGKLKTLKIWHDNSGLDPSWYLLRVMVHDLQTNIKTWFICDRWLAVEEDDGCVERTLTPAGKEELTSFNLLFSTEARKNLTDGHLWFSVLTRPAKSNFTRVQRLSCCLSIMLCTMLANAMFYQVDDQSSSGTSVHLGPFSFSIKQLSIGITSSLVVLPANLLIVTFFRKARPAESKKIVPKDQDPHGQGQKYHATPREETAEPNKESGDKDKQKLKTKKKKTLPHYFVYIAYAMVFICSSVSATFTIFYGLTFGKDKSEGWLSAMMISFWQDVLISQPLKVFAAAMFFALVIKDPNKAEEENEQENNELSPDEEVLHTKAQNSEEEQALRKIGFVDKPPNPEKLEEARQLRLKQKEMKMIIREIIQYFFFLGVLLVVAYGNRDPMAYNVTRAMGALFEEATYTGADPIQEVGDVHTYWRWVHNTFLPTLMPRFWYGPTAIDDDDLLKEEVTKTQTVVLLKKKTSSYKKTAGGNVDSGDIALHPYSDHFVADHATAVLVGAPRLRQLRISKGKCKLLPTFTRMFSGECNTAYEWDFEDEQAYEPYWVPMPSNVSTDDLEPTPWVYQSQFKLKGTPYWGAFATYWGGGYVAVFGADREKAVDLCHSLEAQGWIDRYTRAVFAEFTIYNAYTNFFGVLTLLSEVLPTGGYHHQPKIQTVRLYRYVGPEMVFVMACEITYITCLLYFLYNQVKKYRKEKNEYFKDGWNYPEILVLGFSLSAVGLYFTRMSITKFSIKNMHETPDEFVSFQYVAFMDEWVSATTGAAVFFSFLKFLRLLKFNRRISTLILTIKVAATPLMSFFFMFFILFFAYAQFAFIMFGLDQAGYATFPATLSSMLSLTLGNFDFEALRGSSRVLGPMFFFSYVVAVFFVLMNVFIGILSDAFNDVANDSSKQDNDHEILDFMLHTFKRNIGKQVGPAIKPTYKEPKTQFELNLDSIEEISDNVQYALRNICMEDIRHTNWFEPENTSRKKKLLMLLILETDEDFTENDICDNIPLFDELMMKTSDGDLARKLIYYKEQKKQEEEISEEGDVDNRSEKSSEEDEDGQSVNDSDSEDDKLSVANADSNHKPKKRVRILSAPQEKTKGEIVEGYSASVANQSLVESGTSEV